MIGVDIIEVNRVEKVLEKWGARFLDRVFTEKERAICEERIPPYSAFAARFAAKEASFKALRPSRSVGWTDIEVLSDEQGRPFVVVHGNAKVELGKRSMCVSISHSDHYAIAVAAVVEE
ncbi:MAG: holo-ACP synthase [Candidatus Eisenbacteria bacterium]|nr:holo-ACP synthase [Candidatus Eisenbacteria bacterium]